MKSVLLRGLLAGTGFARSRVIDFKEKENCLIVH